jgi:hypothetical protein
MGCIRFVEVAVDIELAVVVVGKLVVVDSKLVAVVVVVPGRLLAVVAVDIELVVVVVDNRQVAAVVDIEFVVDIELVVVVVDNRQVAAVVDIEFVVDIGPVGMMVAVGIVPVDKPLVVVLVLLDIGPVVDKAGNMLDNNLLRIVVDHIAEMVLFKWKEYSN